MDSTDRDNLWQELDETEAASCVGGIVTTGPVRVLNMVGIAVPAYL